MPPCTSSFIILEKYSCPNHDFELATFSFLFLIALSIPILLFSCGPGGRSPDRVKGRYPMLGVQVGKAHLVVICYKYCIFTFAPFFLYLCHFFRSQNLRIAITCLIIHNITVLHPASHVRNFMLIYLLCLIFIKKNIYYFNPIFFQ